MARVSKHPISNTTLDKLFLFLFECLGKKRTKNDFQKGLLVIFSPMERIMIAKRAAIMFLLLRGVNQRDITKSIKVSSSTVSKFFQLTAHNPQVKELFASLLTGEKLADIVEEMMDILFPPGAYGTNWKAGWERRRNIEQRKAGQI